MVRYRLFGSRLTVILVLVVVLMMQIGSLSSVPSRNGWLIGRLLYVVVGVFRVSTVWIRVCVGMGVVGQTVG